MRIDARGGRACEFLDSEDLRTKKRKQFRLVFVHPALGLDLRLLLFLVRCFDFVAMGDFSVLILWGEAHEVISHFSFYNREVRKYHTRYRATKNVTL